METHCPECGATWSDGRTCTDDFHQMLFWEAEDMPTRGVVHHLMVLGYNLQHPSIYSPETLSWGIKRIGEFVEGVITPQQALKLDRPNVDSGKRKFKITGTPEHHGVYAYPVHWTMRAEDVVARGADNYVESVNAWAKSIHESLKASENS